MDKALQEALKNLPKMHPAKVKAQGFYITGGKGFHITFPNGWTISVQFGPGNYCGNYDRDIRTETEASGKDGSATAETAYWGPDGKMVEEDGDTVQGYQTVDQVMDRIARIRAFPV